MQTTTAWLGDDAHRLAEIGPRLRAEHRSVDHDRVLAHRLHLLDRRRAAEHLRPPADGADALGQHPHEAAVRVDDREPSRRGSRAWRDAWSEMPVGTLSSGSTGASVEADRSLNPLCEAPLHRIFTSRTRGFNQPLVRRAGDAGIACMSQTKKGGRACAHACCFPQHSSCSHCRCSLAACGDDNSGRCRKPLRLDQGRRIQHGRTAHARRRPSCSARRTRTSRSRSASPAPAAASRSSAPARPTSPTRRGRSSPRRSTACKKEGIEYGEAQVANDGIAVVVNPENDWADCLTTAELKKIWEPRSKVNNWNQVKSELPGREDGAVRRRHGLGHVRLLHRADQR